ncbi:23S rRNA (uracil(1939)-C(5))-methyltransferase RlmD [Mycoplasma sp. P36-A1]|uniref:23S rRNA (uracil(1939)-C(5))-methyltransferase RlmD n=1 Tax=Mycoplasma sp. P36-A1 TaxID=3252900 RepID=UPI003C2BE6EA
MENNTLRKNEKIKVDIIDLTFEGLGVAKHNGLAIFVKGALVNEEALIRITKVEKRYALADVISLDVISKDRVKVENKLLDSTIPLQHLRYDKQLAFKTKIIKDIFAKSKTINDVRINKTDGSAKEWHYRNKTQVPVRDENGKMVTGVFSNKSHQVLPVDDFKINLEGIDETVSKVRDILMEFGEKPYNEKRHTGNIRHIIVRKSEKTNEQMIIIVTRSKSLFPTSKIIPAITEKFPNTVSIIQNINNKKSSAIFGNESKTLFGTDSYKEEILNKKFIVTPQSFLQVNTPQAEKLYTKAIDLLQLTGEEIVVDAYSGIGTISLSLADKAKQVIGIEVIQEAVDVANENAKLNNINNVSFKCGLVEEVIDSLEVKPNVIVVDPPRKGLDPDFVNSVININPDKIAYISCNPATLVRDLEKFKEAGYAFNEVFPIDLFPQTVHVETVALLTRKK